MEEITAPARALVFFDIDGTLLLTDGAGRVALRTALEEVYGSSGPLDGYNFHGKTDPRIVVELMTAAGLSEEEVRARLHSVWPVYLRALDGELEVRRAGDRITVLPGIHELLAELERRRGLRVGLGGSLRDRKSCGGARRCTGSARCGDR